MRAESNSPAAPLTTSTWRTSGGRRFLRRSGTRRLICYSNTHCPIHRSSFLVFSRRDALLRESPRNVVVIIHFAQRSYFLLRPLIYVTRDGIRWNRDQMEQRSRQIARSISQFYYREHCRLPKKRERESRCGHDEGTISLGNDRLSVVGVDARGSGIPGPGRVD